MCWWGCEYAPQMPWGADSGMENSVAIRGRRERRLILLHGEVYMLSHRMVRGEARCMSRCMSHQRFWLRDLVSRTFATGSLARQSLTRRRAFARPSACALPVWYTTGRRWPSLCSRCLLLLRLGGNHRSVLRTGCYGKPLLFGLCMLMGSGVNTFRACVG